jgi:uncharacterized protein YdhG (YjbR/CyaY superfamily)
MKSKAATIDDYLEELAPERKAALAAVRKLIREAAPDARESMQYGMAAFELNGLLCGLSSQKNHMALYVCEPEVVDEQRARLGKLDCGKGCIRFRKLEELPLDAIRDIVKAARAKRASAT